MTPVVDTPRIVSIELTNGKITHNGDSCSVRLDRGGIRVGCTYVTIEAAKYLLGKHSEAFPTGGVVVLQ